MKLDELIDDPRLAYHSELNPKLWVREDDYHLDPLVEIHLLKIASQFTEYLKIPDSAVKDVVFTGSNANYNWTKFSDVDVHLLIDFDQIECAEGGCLDASDCLLAKKSLWNDRHDIEIRGHPVEVYTSHDHDATVADSGVFSLISSTWLRRPSWRSVKVDSEVIKVKADELAREIDDIIDSNASDRDAIRSLTDKLWKYRQSGLAKGGEFSVENLVFKALRNNGYLDKIKNYEVKADDAELSLESLDSKVAYNVIHKKDDCFVTRGKIGDRFINVDFFRRNYPYEQNGSKIWSASFQEQDSHGGGRAFDVTGSGNELQVFSMVKDSFIDMFKKYDPDEVWVLSDKSEKRAKLYEKMMKKLLPSSYKLEKRGGSDKQWFGIVKHDRKDIIGPNG